MSYQHIDFVWPQGEDLKISLIYKEGNIEANAAPVDLSSGYAARMDITLPGTNTVVASAGPQQFFYGTGANKQPNLQAYLPRSLTLVGGSVYDSLTITTKFDFDIFLRNLSTERQIKILEGNIKLDRSSTLWL